MILDILSSCLLELQNFPRREVQILRDWCGVYSWSYKLWTIVETVLARVMNWAQEMVLARPGNYRKNCWRWLGVELMEMCGE